MKIFVTKNKYGEVKLQIINKHNRVIANFSDSSYESNDASSILEFIELLKENNIKLEGLEIFN